MILTVGGTKGGSGKTTLATNIAIYLHKNGREVILVDADEQGSASAFNEIRLQTLKQMDYTHMANTNSHIHFSLRELAKRFQDVIVDTGGRDTNIQRAALTVSDGYVIPMVPQAYDMWTAGKVNQMVEEVLKVNPGLQAMCVLNRVQHNASKGFMEEAKTFLRSCDYLELLPDPLIARAAYGHSAIGGLGIAEYKPFDQSASKEFDTFMSTLLKRITDSNNNPVHQLEYHG